MQLVSVVGLPRSGTTFLARMLSKTPKSVYLEEPNPLWRYRNWVKLGHEEFLPSHATTEVTQFIRSQIFSHKFKDMDYVFEKTPANSIRIGFIEAIFPEVKFIFITRNGEKIRNSIKRKWLLNQDKNITKLNDFFYLHSLRTKLKKFQYVPQREVYAYLFSELEAMKQKLFLGRTTHWGPQIRGWKNLYNQSSDEQIYNLWSIMEKTFLNGISKSVANKTIISYEDLVANPTSTLKKALSEINIHNIDVNNLTKSTK